MADGIYLLFIGDDYYPGGGATDCAGVFGSVEAAKASWAPEDGGEWAHVAELQGDSLVILWEGQKKWNEPPVWTEAR